MKKSTTFLTRQTTKYFSVVYALLLFSLLACKDQYEKTYTYKISKPVYESVADIRASFEVENAHVLENPGKIYFKDHYIFINEVDKGIHVFDNSDPKHPQNVRFINIPGNKDIAIRNQTLYADSYMDLVVIDLSNMQEPKETKRLLNVFQDYYYYASQDSIVVDWKEEWITTDEEQYQWHGGEVWMFDNAFRTSVGNGNTNTNGKGGSMARFTLYDHYLYAVGNYDLKLFDIETPANPEQGNVIHLGWGIETIFPYQDKLFIGTTTGMLIYDNSTPENPQYISSFWHARSCDPVVVEGDYAYVTLRGNERCGPAENELNVLDVKDLANPVLLKTYPMQSPYGLGIDNGTLFICEGEFGLKVFDAKNPLTISDNLLAHFKNMDAYDVIPLGNVLLMIGKDGLYQYDYSNPKNLTLLSVIAVQNDQN
jgi:hypothetical protein